MTPWSARIADLDRSGYPPPSVLDPRHKPVLVLDEDDLQLGACVDALSELGHPVAAAHTPSEAMLLAREREFDLLLVAEALRGRKIEEFVRDIRRIRPHLPIVLLVAPERAREAVALFRHGVEDYLLRPPAAIEMRARLGRILEKHELDTHVSFLRGEMLKQGRRRELVAGSPAMHAVVRRIAQIAPMKSTVLILGESGAGKELVARAVHFGSPRRDHPFVALNCAAIPEALIESELFGHEKGAFTGAIARAPGKFELAHRGTLFLDEIAEMRRDTQVKLLRVLEEREFMRVGGGQSIRVDVRVIAATNANLEALVREGRFRRDLYFRLKVITIPVPPLRERAEDIPELARLFLDEICRVNNIPPRRLSEEALEGFRRHSWPGNVRELKNVLESVVVGTVSPVIGIEDLPPAFGEAHRQGGPALPPVRAGATLQEMEREHIRQSLAANGGNRTHTARVLAIGVRTLQRKIREYGL